MKLGREEWKYLLAFFCLAVMVRCLFLVFTGGLAVSLVGDEISYDQAAQALLAGQGITNTFQPPLYSLFLALIYRIFGQNPVIVRLIQVLLNSLLCILIYLVGKKAFNTRIATIALVIAVVYYDLFEMSRFMLSENLFTFFLTGVLYCLYQVKSKDPAGINFYQAMAGILLGLATLTRGITVVFPVVLLFWVIMTRQKMKNFLVIIVFFMLTMSPWVIRNYRVHGSLILTDTHGGIVFLGGNLPEARGQWDAEPVLRRYPHLTDWPEAARDKAYFHEGLKVIRDYPKLAYAQLLSLKFLSLVYPFLPGYDLTFVLILPFLLLGMVYDWQTGRNYLLPGILLLFLAQTLIFFGLPRFRGPLSPVLILLGAAGISVTYDRLKNKTYWWGAGWLLINLFIFFFSERIRLIVRLLRG